MKEQFIYRLDIKIKKIIYTLQFALKKIFATQFNFLDYF